MELIQSLKILGDAARLRMVRLLAREELSVADLQEILGMGQSTISMQLTQLRSAGFVSVRRSGQKSYYSVVPAALTEPVLVSVLDRVATEISETKQDDQALSMLMRRRKDHLQTYFDGLAGKFGRNYVPGRSWKALTDALLRLLPPMVIVDFGAGEGTLALMMARRAERVIAIDSSPRMVEFGTQMAMDHGVTNLEYRLGDMEHAPLESDSADICMFHQALHHAMHPQAALAEAYRVLRWNGRIVVLDLATHDVEAARELYADVWLGFSRVELNEMLTGAGFTNIDIVTADREAEPPHFETIMALADKE